MFIDARTVPEGKTIDTEVCIVGAGAAGITLAREFIGQSFRVCLLESGGLEFDKDTQALYEGEIVGRPYIPLDTARLRYFGGSTNHWAGFCQPLDEVDFESRDWIPNSGWPFSRTQLDPFYKRAQSVLELGAFNYEPEAWETETEPRLQFIGDRVRTKMLQFSSPTRFARVYRDEIVHAHNIKTFLHANALEIETTKDARTATRLRVACLQGNKFWIAGKLFILATGGIENARLLLLSHRVQEAGLGNQNDLVGRFFMDHIGLYSGTMLLTGSRITTDLYGSRIRNFNGDFASNGKSKLRVMAQLTLSGETTRREKLANFSAMLSKITWSEVLRGDDFVESLSNLLRNVDDLAVATFRKFFRRGAQNNLLQLLNIPEPRPNPDSRVTLSTERDVLGQSRTRLNWRLTAADKHNIERAQRIIGMELGRSGLGRLKLGPFPADDFSTTSLGYGRHHMGTTRMHVDPKRGVVDPNSRVHGMANLFIAGSSVFPTYGYAQPTLTIVALALRLADHIRALLNNRRSDSDRTRRYEYTDV